MDLFLPLLIEALQSKVATELIVFDFGMPKAGQAGCASHYKESLEKREEYDVSGWKKNRHVCTDLATSSSYTSYTKWWSG